MKISKDRFEEIISSYLDGEASPEELDLLSRCVRDDPRMAAIFYKACRVHAATCALYGKKVVFGDLDGVELPVFARARPTKTRVFLEWVAVFALMLLSVSSMWYAIKTSGEVDFANADVADSNSLKSGNFASEGPIASSNSENNSTEVTVTPVESSGVFSVIRIKVFAPFIAAE